jgi:phenylacetate-coenzyme A ligase PaaK-like adenylate-forming protein
VDVRLCEVNDPLPRVIAQLNAFQPEMIFGYTAAMVQLAAQQRAGVLRIAPIILTTGGEGMTRNDKEILESAFGCPAVGGYGSSEHLMMGLTAPGRDTMILHDDDVIYEVCDDHCLTTNLFNRTLPLIRYRMSDILRPRAVSSRPPYLEIESLIGRSEQPPQFVNRDGATDFISPHTINEIFVKGVTRFQMQLQGNASFRFVICLDPTLDDAQCDAAVAAVQRRLREILAQKLMDNVRFEVVVAADLPVNPRSRKFQLIVAAPAPAAPAESVEGVA